jgi:hypothetical protein
MPKAFAPKRGGPGRRAPTLTPERIQRITAIIGEWSGKLSWDLLCDAIERNTGSRYTRQALDKHLQIREAYRAFRGAPVPAKDERKLSPTEQKILRLEQQVRTQDAIISAIREKFVRWAYNAHTRRLTEDFLDQPLPAINRSENR